MCYRMVKSSNRWLIAHSHCAMCVSTIEPLPTADHRDGVREPDRRERRSPLGAVAAVLPQLVARRSGDSWDLDRRQHVRGTIGAGQRRVARRASDDKRLVVGPDQIDEERRLFERVRSLSKGAVGRPDPGTQPRCTADSCDAAHARAVATLYQAPPRTPQQRPRRLSTSSQLDHLRSDLPSQSLRSKGSKIQGL
jgi:hypothetical protein